MLAGAMITTMTVVPIAGGLISLRWPTAASSFPRCPCQDKTCRMSMASCTFCIPCRRGRRHHCRSPAGGVCAASGPRRFEGPGSCLPFHCHPRSGQGQGAQRRHQPARATGAAGAHGTPARASGRAGEAGDAHRQSGEARRGHRPQRPAKGGGPERTPVPPRKNTA